MMDATVPINFQRTFFFFGTSKNERPEKYNLHYDKVRRDIRMTILHYILAAVKINIVRKRDSLREK